MDRWSKLRVLINWLNQGRILEVDNVKYSITDDEEIIHLINEERGVPLPTLKHIWNLVGKIPEDQFFIMSCEVTLTQAKQRPRT